MSSILVTIRITVRVQLGVRSGFRNPHSLDYRRSYQRILMKFLWRAGVWPRDQLITSWWRSASLSESGSQFGSQSRSGNNCHVVNTHRTDALSVQPQWVQFWWRSGSPSGSRSPKSEIRIMLAFGGGLCSLSTSSYEGRSKSFATRPYRRMEMLQTTHYFSI